MKPALKNKNDLAVPATTSVKGVQIPATEDISTGMMPDSVTPMGQKETGVPATTVEGGVNVPASTQVAGEEVPAAKYGSDRRYGYNLGIVVPETEGVAGVEVPATRLMDGVEIPATTELYGAFEGLKKYKKYAPVGLVAVFGLLAYYLYKRRR